MVDQYVITCRQRWKQIAITFIEINIRDLYMSLWSLKVGRYSSQGTWCYIMRACRRGYKVETRAVFSHLLLPVFRLRLWTLLCARSHKVITRGGFMKCFSKVVGNVCSCTWTVTGHFCPWGTEHLFMSGLLPATPAGPAEGSSDNTTI